MSSKSFLESIESYHSYACTHNFVDWVQSELVSRRGFHFKFWNCIANERTRNPCDIYIYNNPGRERASLRLPFESKELFK